MKYLIKSPVNPQTPKACLLLNSTLVGKDKLPPHETNEEEKKCQCTYEQWTPKKGAPENKSMENEETKELESKVEKEQ